MKAVIIIEKNCDICLNLKWYQSLLEILDVSIFLIFELKKYTFRQSFFSNKLLFKASQELRCDSLKDLLHLLLLNQKILFLFQNEVEIETIETEIKRCKTKKFFIYSISNL